MLAPFAVGLALFVMAGALTDLVERTGLFRVPFDTALRRAAGLPRSTWGTAFAHFGIGVTLLGIVGETGWSAEKIVTLKPGADGVDPPLRSHLRRHRSARGAELPRADRQVHRAAQRRRRARRAASRRKRIFAARGMTTTEAALMTRGFSQLYLSLGDHNPDGSIAIRLYHKPLVLLIWLGALVMVVGGALSLSDRRLRVGAPKPAKARDALQPAE